MYWGYSEPLDFYKEFHQYTGDTIETAPNELHILLLGSGDPRHILKTLSKSHTNDTKIIFYMLEGCWEIIARNILLLNIALEQSTELSIKGKTHLFMDIYGNALIRPASYNYMCSKATHYANAITDLDYARQTMQMLNFDMLKFSERDNLQNIFDFWQSKKENIFNISKYWEDRVRADLATRYDSRMGAFDWDLQMKLKDYGASQICPQEYKHWRDIGVAFVFPEYEQVHANKTLAVGLMRYGDQYKHRGYLGDIHIGPFCAFGLNCTDNAFLQSNHGTNRFRATDLTERNIYEIMHEITTKESYAYRSKDAHEFGGTCIQISKPFENVQTALVNNVDDLKKFNKPFMLSDNVSIRIMSPEHLLKFQKLPEFQRYFNAVFVARNYFDFLRHDEFKFILKDAAMVYFETRQYSIGKREDISEFLTKIKTFAKDVKLKALTHFNINVPMPIVRYINVCDEINE